MLETNRIIDMSHSIVRVFLVLIFSLLLMTHSNTIVQAASVSNELGNDTTFLIQEYEEYIEYEEFTITVTVYDKVTGEPIGDIKVELFYKGSDNGFTGSNGNYLTDKDGTILFEVSTLTKGDEYHFKIDTPGYYPYIGEGFELTGDMNIIIYLDPIEDDPEEDIPLIPLEPSIPAEPDPEPEQELLPDDTNDDYDGGVGTGDDSSILYYMVLGMTAILFMILIVLMTKRNDDDEDDQYIYM